MAVKDLDDDQKAVLYVYSKYSSENKTVYLQYTAALVLFYYLMQNDIFPSYSEQLLVYDYKDSRRYMWEDKKFMADINIIRDFGFLNRARLKTVSYRDMNAHCITHEGMQYITNNKNILTDKFNHIDGLLKCKCGKYLHVSLDDECPVLRCEKCKKKEIPVNGFLYDISEPITYRHSSSFL